jgi:hypothetical protein
MKFLKKEKLKVLIFLFIIITILCSASFYYWTTTPQYALSQIRKAFTKHDVTLALKYIDADAIADDFWKQIEVEALNKMPDPSNEFESAGIALGQNIMEKYKPMIKESLRSKLIDSIKSDSNKDDTKENVIWMASKNEVSYYDGDIAVVDTSDPAVKLNLKKEQGVWRVVAIKGFTKINPVKYKQN